MYKSWAVAERDLRKFFRTPLLMASSVGFPVLHLLVMGYSFKGELRNLPVAVVNQDQGPYARKVQQNLLAVVAGNKTFELHWEQDEQQAQRMVRNGYYRAAIIIPPRFSRQLARGEPAALGLILDNSDSITSEGIHLTLQGAVQALALRPGLKPPPVPGVDLQPVQIFRKIEYIQYLVPGVIIMAAFMGTMISGGTNLVMDRFLGVHESYFLTPLSRTDIVLGMLTSGMITTSTATLIVWIICSAVTGLWPPDWVSALLAALLVVVTSVGMLGLMFLAYARVRNPRAIGVVGGFLNMILYFPSGAIYPVESFPPWLRAFSKIDPETYAVRGMKACLLQGAEPAAVIGDILIVLAFAVGTAVLAIVTFRRRL